MPQYSYALSDYNKAIELNPNEASSYKNRGGSLLLSFEGLSEGDCRLEKNFADSSECAAGFGNQKRNRPHEKRTRRIILTHKKKAYFLGISVERTCSRYDEGTRNKG